MWIYIVCKLINLFIALLNKKPGVESQCLSASTERQTEEFMKHPRVGIMYTAGVFFIFNTKYVQYL